MIQPFYRILYMHKLSTIQEYETNKSYSYFKRSNFT